MSGTWTTNTATNAILAMILALGAGARLATLNAPFGDSAEGVGCFFGILGRNYVAEAARSRGVPIQSEGRHPDVQPLYYYHHPPLVPLLVAGSYAVFGLGDWQTRLPTAVCSLAVAAALVLVFRAQQRSRVGLLAAAVWIAMPMTTYFGGMPDVISPQLALFVLLTVAAYVRFSRLPSTRPLLWLCAAFVPAGLTDWPAFYLLPILLVAFALMHPWRRWGWIIAFCAIGTVLFVALNAHIAIVAAQKPLWIFSLFTGRSAGGTGHTWTLWLERAWLYLSAEATIPVLALAVFGCFWLWSGREKSPAGGIGRLLLLWSVLHVVVGKQGCIQHAWWWWPLVLALAVAAGFAVDAILTKASVRWRTPAHALAAIAVAAIFGWGLWWRVPELCNALDYSRAMAQAIRAVAPGANDTVLVVTENDCPVLWYYAHRPLRTGVWTIAGFHAATVRTDADLSFGFRQPWPFPSRALVVPPSSRGHIPDLLNYLERHHALIPSPPGLEAYLFFDLERSQGGKLTP